ncbi:MAG: hypothetical protein WKG07_16095 [Hymenobacter sp.]
MLEAMQGWPRNLRRPGARAGSQPVPAGHPNPIEQSGTYPPPECGPARPLPAVRAHWLPHRAGGNGRAERHHRHRRGPGAARAGGRRRAPAPAAGAPGGPQPRAAQLREPAGARHLPGHVSR